MNDIINLTFIYCPNCITYKNTSIDGGDCYDCDECYGSVDLRDANEDLLIDFHGLKNLIIRSKEPRLVVQTYIEYCNIDSNEVDLINITNSVLAGNIEELETLWEMRKNN
jgi:hypothetical protein